MLTQSNDNSFLKDYIISSVNDFVELNKLDKSNIYITGTSAAVLDNCLSLSTIKDIDIIIPGCNYFGVSLMNFDGIPKNKIDIVYGRPLLNNYHDRALEYKGYKYLHKYDLCFGFMNAFSDCPYKKYESERVDYIISNLTDIETKQFRQLLLKGSDNDNNRIFTLCKFLIKRLNKLKGDEQ